MLRHVQTSTQQRGQDKSLSSRKNSQVDIRGLITGQLILSGLWQWGTELKGHGDQVCKVSGKSGGGGGGLRSTRAKRNKYKHNTTQQGLGLSLNVVPLHRIKAALLGGSSSEGIKAMEKKKKKLQCTIWLRTAFQNVVNLEQITDFN